MLMKILIITIIIIIIILVLTISISKETKYINKNKKDAQNQHARKILYSYGLFSNDPMTETMNQTIRKNGKTTHLSHVVLGSKDVEEDIQTLKFQLFHLQGREEGDWCKQLSDVYHSIPRGVSKSDLARLIHLYVRGGHYADLDVEFHQIPIIGDEVVLYTENYAILPRIANYAISSPPEHPFILAVIKEIVERVQRKVGNKGREGSVRTTKTGNLQEKKNSQWSDDDVLQTTGPDVITDVYRSWYKGGVKRLGLINSKRILTHKAEGSWRGGK